MDPPQKSPQSQARSAGRAPRQYSARGDGSTGPGRRFNGEPGVIHFAYRGPSNNLGELARHSGDGMARREASRFLVRVLRSRYRDHRVELSQFKRHIRRGASVCDVGAHKGSFLFWLARWCSPGRAIAFEPQPDLASELERVCAKFSLDNVVIERKAAHSTSGSKQFFIPDGRKAGASLLKPDMTFQAMDVEAIALDEYFKPTEDVAAIKIDVEGSELDVLLGARLTGACRYSSSSAIVISFPWAACTTRFHFSRTSDTPPAS